MKIMTLKQVLKRNGVTITELRRWYSDLIKGRGKYWLSDAYKLYKLTHRNFKVRKKDFFIIAAIIVTGQFDEVDGKVRFRKQPELARELARIVMGINLPKPEYPDKDEFKRIISRYIPVFHVASRNKLFLDVERPSWPIIAVNRKFLVDRAIKDFKLKVKLLRFLKDKGTVSYRQLLRRFSNKRFRDIYPHLLLFEKYGVIVWDVDNHKISYVGDTIQIGQPT